MDYRVYDLESQIELAKKHEKLTNKIEPIMLLPQMANFFLEQAKKVEYIKLVIARDYSNDSEKIEEIKRIIERREKK